MRYLLLCVAVVLFSSCIKTDEGIIVKVIDVDYTTSSSFVINGSIEGEIRDYNFLLKEFGNAKEKEIPAIGDRNDLYGFCYDLESGKAYLVSLFAVVNSDTIFSNGFKVETVQPITVTDLRDSNSYEVVKVGDQTWFAENARFNTEGSCFYNKDSMNYLQNGKFYTWEMAQNVCPEGWHIPSDEEWLKLELFLGMPEDYINSFERPFNDNTALPLLNFGFSYNLNSTVTNEYGFNVKATGTFNGEEFTNIDNPAYYWTGSKTETNNGVAEISRAISKDGSIGRYTTIQQSMMAVRCIKDE